MRGAGWSDPSTAAGACLLEYGLGRVGQVVATISPPLFVWANARFLTGAWCVLATTYNEDIQSCITMVDITAADLVPIAALLEQA